MGAGEVLVDVVVGVDQARRDQAPVRPQHPLRHRLLVTRPAHGRNQASVEGDPAPGELTVCGVECDDKLGPVDQQLDGHTVTLAILDARVSRKGLLVRETGRTATRRNA